MKIKYLLTVIATVAITKNSFAQYAQDVVRFSTFQNGSTSRIKAIGNAGTAIGGDLSSISGNPAGLGFFTHSEFNITPEFDGSKVNSAYFGQNANTTNNHGNLNNASVVIYQQLNIQKGRDKTKGWLSINYGAGYSRTNNFYEDINYGGRNPNNSISDYFAGIANNHPNDALGGWAYNHGIVDNFGTSTNPDYASTVSTPINQNGIISRTGGQSEFDFAFGANYSNKLYIGVGVAITDIRYDYYRQFTETGSASIPPNGGTVGVPTDFNSAYVQSQSTRGNGANIKLGVIYKPIEALRLGFTFTSPTYYSIDDSYNEGLTTNINGRASQSDQLGASSFTYDMRTPLKLAGGAAFFIGKYGFISGDVEYIDYASAHINSNQDFDNTSDINQIKADYRSTINVHVGAEARVTSMFYLRGGYSQQGSPFKNNSTATDITGDIKTVTGGIGLRFGAYYVDATYAHITGSEVITPYLIDAGNPTASFKKTNNNAFLTLGYRF
ncbi:OmpP1/FadL family transporter [Mucilaginibacter aquaedulcis]|uniref:OmpP1/FadL family transporter n=1 Tax=Mucilaginibacter aquaedulcis TaxID=1187081 RepID=UPI0025B4D4A4|nr:outer membrane protein transport protein [Mucilaginibacter aquaedulcis]MDN3549234.1 outer membrane protein transport protein [Mucilaginibacter aquaedulcis]